jgi:multisubunit Na+/H+ antiporter MnhB subunit
VKRLLEIAAIATVAFFLVIALSPGDAVADGGDQGTRSRRYVVERGVEETGAVNLVTAIYLGYRVFDTLGETVVLLLAVTGVTFFVGKTG